MMGSFDPMGLEAKKKQLLAKLIGQRPGGSLAQSVRSGGRVMNPGAFFNQTPHFGQHPLLSLFNKFGATENPGTLRGAGLPTMGAYTPQPPTAWGDPGGTHYDPGNDTGGTQHLITGYAPGWMPGDPQPIQGLNSQPGVAQILNNIFTSRLAGYGYGAFGQGGRLD